ncbi:hypothetical protein TW85_02475 [Marinomonas sp. S3726]|nr:hypothetical protein TW85_02475 [Marinomonas sp. S3726]
MPQRGSKRDQTVKRLDLITISPAPYLVFPLPPVDLGNSSFLLTEFMQIVCLLAASYSCLIKSLINIP